MLQRLLVKNLWHHVELHGHGDDVEADHCGDHKVKVLGRDQLVYPQPRRRVVDVVRHLQHFCEEEGKLGL